MIRRVALLLAATSILGACTTFTDNDLAARVDDDRLTQAEFDQLANAAFGQPEAERVEVPMRLVRDVLNTWIVTRIVAGDVIAAGIEPASGPGGPDAFESLLLEQDAIFEQWLELDPASDEEFRAAYERGPEFSEVVCTAHILVDTEAEANEVAAELAAGADFATLAAERSTDPGSAIAGGVLPCSPLGGFSAQYVEEYVEAALAATLGEPTDPVQSMFGWHIILLRPWDEVADDPEARAVFDDVGVRFRRSARAADIRVDPRFGAFSPEFGVLELG